jgi:hypothetical protein
MGSGRVGMTCPVGRDVDVDMDVDSKMEVVVAVIVKEGRMMGVWRWRLSVESVVINVP